MIEKKIGDPPRPQKYDDSNKKNGGLTPPPP